MVYNISEQKVARIPMALQCVFICRRRNRHFVVGRVGRKREGLVARCLPEKPAQEAGHRIRGADGREEMKIEYDPVRDLLYIWFGVPGEKAARTEIVIPGVHADFNSRGN